MDADLPTPLRRHFDEGVRLFRQREYFEAHEEWETVWHAAPDALRAPVQGLIQLAAGLHHLHRGNVRGGERLLASGAARLAAVSSPFLGLDLDELWREVAARRAESQEEG